MSDRGFVSLKSLKGKTPRSPAEIIAEIRTIYFKTTKQTIQHDLAHAVELLKSLPDEDARDRAAVYMHGLAEMRTEWLGRAKRGARKPKP